MSNQTIGPVPTTAIVPEALKPYAMSFPVAAPASAHWADRAVKQGNADYCAIKGHASWVEDGVDKGICPRCGEVTR